MTLPAPDDLRAERSHARWTWTIAGMLVALLLMLWALGRGPDGAAACCAIPAIHAPSAMPSTDAQRGSPTEAPAAKP